MGHHTFTKIEAGSYRADFNHGYNASLYRTPEGKWSYTFWHSSEVKLQGGHFKRMKEARSAAYDEAHQITVSIINIMSGKEVQESITTPWSCSVASETYWCS